MIDKEWRGKKEQVHCFLKNHVGRILKKSCFKSY